VNFSHVRHAVIGLLVIEGRLSYRRLQAEFDLDLLAPVYDSITQGFDTADLRDAKALLDELAPPARTLAAG
jgi:hypothetical protein